MNLRSVFCKQRWSDKREARILHPPIRKARREHQQVVDAPLVWSTNVLTSRHKFLGVLKLPGALVHHLLLAPDLAPGPDPPALHSRADQRHEVAGDGERLLESVHH